MESAVRTRSKSITFKHLMRLELAVHVGLGFLFGLIIQVARRVSFHIIQLFRFTSTRSSVAGASCQIHNRCGCINVALSNLCVYTDERIKRLACDGFFEYYPIM